MKKRQDKLKALAYLLFLEAENPDSPLNKYLKKLAEKFALENQDRVGEGKLQLYLTKNLRKITERMIRSD